MPVYKEAVDTEHRLSTEGTESAGVKEFKSAGSMVRFDEDVGTSQRDFGDRNWEPCPLDAGGHCPC